MERGILSACQPVTRRTVAEAQDDHPVRSGLVTAIEIANRLSINVLLPDLQGNVAGSSDDVSWVIILYNLGFLCSLASAIG